MELYSTRNSTNVHGTNKLQSTPSKEICNRENRRVTLVIAGLSKVLSRGSLVVFVAITMFTYGILIPMAWGNAYTQGCFPSFARPSMQGIWNHNPQLQRYVDILWTYLEIGSICGIAAFSSSLLRKRFIIALLIAMIVIFNQVIWVLHFTLVD